MPKDIHHNWILPELQQQRQRARHIASLMIHQIKKQIAFYYSPFLENWSSLTVGETVYES